MFNKIKEWIVDKVNKVIDTLVNTVWEVKGWVIYLLGGLIGLEIGRCVVRFAPPLSLFMMSLATYWLMSMIILVAFLIIFFMYGVKNMHKTTNWRIVI